ncbi:MAG TPA: hypothetical protein VI874_01750, partial [Candidatus Norongarragalinales archaeon]|nr:hypothetical protein [Candidatus Norongarragalinales archaeon]
ADSFVSWTKSVPLGEDHFMLSVMYYEQDHEPHAAVDWVHLEGKVGQLNRRIGDLKTFFFSGEKPRSVYRVFRDKFEHPGGSARGKVDFLGEPEVADLFREVMEHLANASSEHWPMAQAEAHVPGTEAIPSDRLVKARKNLNRCIRSAVDTPPTNPKE